MTRFFKAVQVSTCRRDTIIKNSWLALVLALVGNVSQCYADVSVGDSYGGGTVFCVSPTPDIKNCVTHGSGKYGLIMANEDQVNFDSNPRHGVTWASKNKETGALSGDDGLANTQAIIAAYPEDGPSNNAAWLAQAYNMAHGQDADAHLTVWYLPAKNELNKMYLYAQANNLIGRGCSGSKVGGVQCLVGGYKEGNGLYWSSSEYYYPSSWYQDFSRGNQGSCKQNTECFGARVVRAFNLLIQPVNHLSQLQIREMVERFIQRSEETGAIDTAELLELLRHRSSGQELLPLLDLLDRHPKAVFAAGLLNTWLASQHETDQATLLRLAQSVHTKKKGLMFIVAHPAADAPVLRAVITNPHVNAEILAAVAACPLADADTLLAVVCNPSVPSAVLQRVLRNTKVDLRMLSGAVRRSDNAPALLLQLVHHGLTDADLLALIALHPNTNLEVLAAVAQHARVDQRGLAVAANCAELDADSRLAIARNPQTALESLASMVSNQQTNAATLGAVARRPEIGGELLLAIVQHPQADRTVWVAVANHPNLNLATLAAMVERRVDDGETLRVIAQHRLTSLAILKQLVRQQEVSLEILTDIAGQEQADAELLEELAKLPRADARLLLAIAGNPHTSLASLKQIIHSRNLDLLVLQALANHQNTDTELLAAVAGDKLLHGLHNAEAQNLIVALLRNPQADIHVFTIALQEHPEAVDAVSLLNIARNRNADLNTLKQLMRNRNVNREMLLAMVGNPAANGGVLYDIARHPQADGDVLAGVLRHPNLNRIILSLIVSRRTEVITAPMLNTMVADVNTEAGILRSLVGHRLLDREILINILRHPQANLEVLDTVEQRHDLLDGDLLDMLIARRAEVLAAIHQQVNATAAPAFEAPHVIPNLARLFAPLPPPPPYSSSQ